MSRPITWQNIQGPNYMAASRILGNASREFDNSFDALGGLLKGEQDRLAQNRQNTIDNNTAAFQDRLNQFTNPEDLAAARDQLLAARAGYGNMIDRDATRGLVDSTMATLQNRATAQREYRLGEQRAEANPLISRIAGLAAKGEEQQANDLIEQNRELFSDIGQYDDVLQDTRSTLRGLADDEYNDGQRERTLELQGIEDAERDRVTAINALIEKDLKATAQMRDIAIAQGTKLGFSPGEFIDIQTNRFRIDNPTAKEADVSKFAAGLTNLLIDEPMRAYEQDELDYQNRINAFAQKEGVTNNPFYMAEGENSQAAIADVLTALGNTRSGVDPDAERRITQIITEGYDVVREDGTRETLKIPAQLMKALMLPAENDFNLFGIDLPWGTDDLDAGSVDKRLERYLQKDEKGLKEMQQYLQFKAKRANAGMPGAPRLSLYDIWK